MINWRKISEVGLPIQMVTYLVTDGRDISTTEIDITRDYNTGEIKFKAWTGDGNTWEDNQCCSGARCFEMKPTHWCPVSELNLPG